MLSLLHLGDEEEKAILSAVVEFSLPCRLQGHDMKSNELGACSSVIEEAINVDAFRWYTLSLLVHRDGHEVSGRLPSSRESQR